jgi:hypothetical protein
MTMTHMSVEVVRQRILATIDKRLDDVGPTSPKPSQTPAATDVAQLAAAYAHLCSVPST